MTCPLINNVIDSDLCYDVQECIEGNIPVSLELEDFLERGDCEKICHECEYNVLSDQCMKNNLSAEDDEEEYYLASENADINDVLPEIVKKLDRYKLQLVGIIGNELAAYEKMTTERKESEEGIKQKDKLKMLSLGMSKYVESISAFQQYVDYKETGNVESDRIISDIVSDEVDQKADAFDDISYDEWVERLQKSIQIMMSTFRFSGLEEPRLSFSASNYEGHEQPGTSLDIFVEMASTNGKPVKEDFVLKIHLYTSDDKLAGAEEIDVPAGTFKGYKTYRFHFDNCSALKNITYGRLFISKF